MLIGEQFVGKPRDEAHLLDIAARIEGAFQTAR
jgi:Asp-tRNA(Asn)/Glu-tRNA(Gln) amidotransferase A subunit family amidase